MIRCRDVLGGLALGAALLPGCASDDYGSSSSVTVGASFYYGSGWYGSPSYWYDYPDYVVVPPDRPGEPGDPGRPGTPGAHPENPIASPPGEGGANRPSQQPSTAQPSTRSSQSSASSRSRMPSSQPRTSSSSRSSMPRASRGGGGFRR